MSKNTSLQQKIVLYGNNSHSVVRNSILRQYFTLSAKNLIFTGILYSQQQ